MGRVAALLVPATALALLAACKDEKKPAETAASAATAMTRARDAAEQNLRTGPAAARMSFRGVETWTQSLPDRIAVCGQVAPFADDPNIFVPFVSVVTPVGETMAAARSVLAPGQQSAYQIEQHVGTDPAEASRVYAAIVNYCYEKGGPSASPYLRAAPVPPLPDSPPDLHAGPNAAAAAPAPAPAPAPATPPTATAGTPASGSVTMRRNGNLHSDPHGPTIQVVSQGTVMKVFARAPGGWYQVGDNAPWGWVHESMLNTH